MEPKPVRQLWILLQAATFCVFAGRAWQHLFWDAPYRELLWDDRLMRPVIEALTPWSWHEYATNLAVDEAIQRWMTFIGIFYICCAFLAIFYRYVPVIARIILWIGTAGLAFLAVMYMKEYFLHLGQLLEYTLQVGAPVLLITTAHQKVPSARLLLWMKIAIALTFICHGLYAVGYYPRPGYYTAMTMRILGLQEPAAIFFLNVAGTLDFVVAAGIFLPWKWAKWALAYAAFWGLATSLARIAGNFYWETPWESLHQWVYQAVYRFPHFLIPIAAYVVGKWLSNPSLDSSS